MMVDYQTGALKLVTYINIYADNFDLPLNKTQREQVPSFDRPILLLLSGEDVLSGKDIGAKRLYGHIPRAVGQTHKTRSGGGYFVQKDPSKLLDVQSNKFLTVN